MKESSKSLSSLIFNQYN